MGSARSDSERFYDGGYVEVSLPPGQVKFHRAGRQNLQAGESLNLPFLDGYRLFVEYEGKLLGPEGGELFTPGDSAYCRYDSTHTPPEPNCTCGYYLARHPLDVWPFFSPGCHDDEKVNGLRLRHWKRQDQKAKTFPVLAAVRLHDPMTGAGFRGSRMELTGSVIVMNADSGARLSELGLTPVVVGDMWGTVESVLTDWWRNYSARV
ncbi:hypothetical protein GcLGCM259_1799 [Glutamicibacter creatinolyticus]|uniref:Uncharacterized protein n=1 Tax=Glutamicibacter creatinolyticus TaxID=162496 RepID=A0A5B7WUD9_9MICC|nr:hypothetical protein [Glutamicibacter creatinolyticus]QCY47517.1 hypothetical protein GcLGCM259_1799 [Glutamicibacter creatinolyticus]